MRPAKPSEPTFALMPFPGLETVLVSDIEVEQDDAPTIPCLVVIGQSLNTDIPTVIVASEIHETGYVEVYFYQHFENNDWLSAEHCGMLLENSNRKVHLDDLTILGFLRLQQIT